MNATEPSVKQRAHYLVDRLPKKADWKDLAYEVSVMQDIEEALMDSDADQVSENDIVRNRFGLPNEGALDCQSLAYRLQQIHDRIAQDQPQNAKRFVDCLTLRAEAIALYPQAGRVVPEYRSDSIREIFEGPYRIIYRIRPDRIDILTVRHGASMLPARTQDL